MRLAGVSVGESRLARAGPRAGIATVPTAALRDIDDEIAALRNAVEGELGAADGAYAAPMQATVPSTGRLPRSRARRVGHARQRGAIRRRGRRLLRRCRALLPYVGLIVLVGALAVLGGIVAVYLAGL